MYVITGANGFIGSVLARQLNVLGEDDLILVDSVDPQTRPGPLSHAKYTDYLPSEGFPEILRKNSWPRKITAVFHMGACSSTTENDLEYLRKNNTEYSKSLFQICAELRVPYIYASSGAVYGDGTRGFDDSTPTEEFKPLNPYGWSKLHFDHWVLKEGFPQAPPLWAGLRFFNVYGPNEYHKGDMASLVYKAFQQIRQTKELKLFRSFHPDYADGMQMRDFVYVKDISRWCLEILAKDSFNNGIYNMGFGKARTWLDLADSIFSSLNLPVKINWVDPPENIRNQYQYFTEAKMDRWLAQGLSRPEWSIEEGVKDYIHNHLLQSDPYY